jgi:DNA-directed RNA polymerase subunit D
MKIEIMELEPKKAVIKIEDTKPYFVNSIRRIMLSDLPKLAIQDVVIYDNTSALFDEIITHRLGLIPIPTDFKLLTYKDKCVCKGKGCPNCTIRYTLSKEGEGIVFSGDLQSADKSWAITEDKIPIIELFNDQRLILEVEAILGKARDHAKWQGVIAPRYKMDLKIEFDINKKNEVKEFIEKLPKDLVKIKNNKIELKDISKLSIFESYLEKEKIDFITINKDPAKIIFSFETDGSFTAKNALLESSKILENKYSEFRKLINNL